MAQFDLSSAHTAVAAIKNPTSKAFDYVGTIYMGTDLAVMSQVSFHLNAGEEKNISFLVTMPSVSGVYPIHLGVSSGGVSIALYKATEDVVIVAIRLVDKIEFEIRATCPPREFVKETLGVKYYIWYYYKAKFVSSELLVDEVLRNPGSLGYLPYRYSSYRLEGKITPTDLVNPLGGPAIRDLKCPSYISGELHCELYKSPSIEDIPGGTPQFVGSAVFPAVISPDARIYVDLTTIQ